MPDHWREALSASTSPAAYRGNAAAVVRSGVFTAAIERVYSGGASTKSRKSRRPPPGASRTVDGQSGDRRRGVRGSASAVQGAVGLRAPADPGEARRVGGAYPGLTRSRRSGRAARPSLHRVHAFARHHVALGAILRGWRAALPATPRKVFRGSSTPSRAVDSISSTIHVGLERNIRDPMVLV